MKRSIRRKLFLSALILLVIFFAGFLIPEEFSMPVRGAGRESYDQHSFWAYPWGRSVTHKGVDIFARQGTDVLSSTKGIVLFQGNTPIGGNVVWVLGPQWRLHYYAHLKDIHTSMFSWVGNDEVLGTVGSTGNAVGKPPHLHYMIKTLIPYPWQNDNSIQGNRKMFYVNPVAYLNRSIDPPSR
jgi:murein DD-endopeptidase MepM/ murein hydrolase activator NlpD